MSAPRSLAALAAAFVLLAAAVSAGAMAPIQRVTSPKGVTALLVEDHSVPIVSISYSFAGGAALDPAGKEGLANMVSDLLDEGAGDYDSQAFQGRVDDLAIGMDFSADQDEFGGGLRTVTANLDTAIDLLGLALAKPRFDPDAVERVRKQELSGIASDQDDPDAVAGKALAALVYPGHPYGRPVGGTAASVAAITRDDLVWWAGHRLGRDHLVVSVVGDVSAARLAPLLDTAFAGLPAASAPGSVPEVQAQGAGRLQIIRRDIPQSDVAFAEQGIKRDDKDWYAAFVLNQILGGGDFSSRLMTEVRLKRGLAYQVGSYLLPREHGALIGGGVATRNDRVADSLAVVKQTWDEMRDHGASAAAVTAAKTYLNGSFPLQMGSTGSLASLLAVIQRDRLGLDYLDRRSRLIDAVTPADVARVARRLLDSKSLAVVVVGNPAGM